MKEHLTKLNIFISIIIFILLLMSKGLPVYAGETVLNSALSVSVPDQQTGNPEDFLIYVLSFQNRNNSPVDLQVEYLTGPNWDLIGDSMVTIPANAKNFYFPITVIIPHDAQANLVKKIEIRFKISGQAFTLPIVSIPVLVNPVSAINFAEPPPQNGLCGSTINYNVKVTNNGNTLEHFSVKGVSENDWPLEVEPDVFELNPGESRAILIKHQIPGYSETDYDQIKLQFSWGNQQKLVLLTTSITDKFAKMADRYYIWQGQASISHPNITDFNLTDPNLSFSMSGQWKPDNSCQLYFSDLLNDTNRHYYTHFKTDSWDVKTGDFSLAWEGLIAPKSSLGNLRVAHNDGDRSYGVYAWEPTEEGDNLQPFGLETFLNKNSRISLLNESFKESDQTVFEWDYQNNINPGLRWSNSLAYNASDSNSYALGVGVERFKGNWYFTSNLQAFKKISDYLDKKRLQLTLYQPFSNESMTIYNQFIYEARTLEDFEPNQSLTVTDFDDYSLETILNWPFGLNLRFSYQYQLAGGSFSKDNISLFLEDAFEVDRYQHEWWFSHSIDHLADDPDSNYTKFNWETEYALSKNEDLIFNPQFVSNSASSENESKLGFGFQQRLNHNSLEWKSSLYRYFTTKPKHSLECSLEWRLFQYQLSLQYIGVWHSSDYITDTFSLTLRNKFSIPIKKPLGTVEGIAFLDRNQNGSFDNDEPLLRKMIMILDGSTAFETDESGHYALSGLAPGEHQISLDPLYEVIYIPKAPVITFTVKQYQIVHLELPFIRSQNITGIIFFDRNMNGYQDPDEPNLTGIPISLTNISQKEEPLTYSNRDGQFIFYQLAPGSYQFKFDNNLLPDNMQSPEHVASIIIEPSQSEEASPIRIGLIPFERPINIVKEEAKLLLLLNQELVKPGDVLEFIIESDITLKSLELLLPTGEKIQFESVSKNKTWKYQWQVPMNIPAGQVKIVCKGIDIENKIYQEEAMLVIIP